MRVRWTKDAADDLEPICDYIARSRPESARRIAQSATVGTRRLSVERARVVDTVFACFPVREALETARQIAEAIEATRRTSSTAISMIRDEDDVTSISSTVVLVMGFAREMRGRTS